MELAMLPQAPPVLVQKGVHKEKPPSLGLEKGGEKQIIEICKASTGWWHRGGHSSFPLAASPAAPAPPRSPCPWQCREEEITSEVFCLNLIMARAGFLLLYF